MPESTNHIKQLRKTLELIESRQDRRQCPHCSSTSIYKNGFSANGLQRYLCRCCGTYYNSLTNTPLANLRKKDLWIQNLKCMNDSMTLRRVAIELNINLKTAFRWRHRFAEGFEGVNDKQLEGIVESDETFFSYSQKGNRNLYRLKRKPHQRGNGYTNRGLSYDQVCVLTACDRSKHSIEKIAGFGPLNNFNADRLLNGIITSDSVLVTDGSSTYKSFAKRHDLAHQIVYNKKGMRSKGCYHIQHINNYHAMLKNWIDNGFHGVATKYLTHYLQWFHMMKRQSYDPEKMLDFILRETA